MDQDDASPERIADPGKSDRRSVKLNFANIGRLGAGDDFHQGRFAGAIFPDDRQHFAGSNVEIDAIERPHAGKRFAEISDLEQRRHRPPLNRLGWSPGFSRHEHPPEDRLKPGLQHVIAGDHRPPLPTFILSCVLYSGIVSRPFPPALVTMRVGT
jgi:hypothetical protein